MHRAIAQYAAPPAEDSEIVGRYSQLIDRVARRIAWRTGDPSLREELWSAGAIGLLEAAGRFDPAQDVRFETFVEHRIRGAMLDELRRMDHLPRRLRAKTDKVSKMRRKLSQQLGREPEHWEVAEALDVSVEEVAHLDNVSRPHLTLEDIHHPPSDESPEDATLVGQQVEQLTTAVGILPERLQLLLSLHYVEGLTYREIGEVLEVSEARICQLHKEAVERLREHLAE